MEIPVTGQPGSTSTASPTLISCRRPQPGSSSAGCGATPAASAPWPNQQLAAYYRRAGHDEDARRVLLARQRARYASPGTALITKTWGLLQEVTVGYGYRPWLAGIWPIVLVTAGTLFFAAHPPAPANAAQHASFDSLPYTIGLVIPLINTGQQNQWNPTGFSEVIAYLLIGLGLALATSLAACITRILTRN